jgi:hypothetical protein
MSTSTWKELEEQLIARAIKDDSYRQELISDPRAAVEQQLGYALSPQVQIQVIEHDPETVYLLLPKKEETSAELSDEQLDSVAGGVLGQVVGATCRGSGCGSTAITLIANCSLPLTR